MCPCLFLEGRNRYGHYYTTADIYVAFPGIIFWYKFHYQYDTEGDMADGFCLSIYRGDINGWYIYI